MNGFVVRITETGELLQSVNNLYPCVYIEVVNDNVYVTASGINIIYHFSQNLTLLDIPKFNLSYIGDPRSIKYDLSTGHLYTPDYLTNWLNALDLNLKRIESASFNLGSLGVSVIRLMALYKTPTANYLYLVKGQGIVVIDQEKTNNYQQNSNCM